MPSLFKTFRLGRVEVELEERAKRYSFYTAVAGTRADIKKTNLKLELATVGRHRLRVITTICVVQKRNNNNNNTSVRI